MLIVLEGLDGAGKSTQVKRLKEYLTERCGGLEYIHFPRYDAPVYGDLIGRFLKGEFGSIEAVHPQLVALLFAEDRHRAAPILREALDAGKVVLLDRYVYSNIAYQCAKLPQGAERTRLRNWIFDTEYGDFNLPEPDLNLFLDVPIGFVSRASRRTASGDTATISTAARTSTRRTSASSRPSATCTAPRRPGTRISSASTAVTPRAACCPRTTSSPRSVRPSILSSHEKGTS
jgi:Thymidylate kinase